MTEQEKKANVTRIKTEVAKIGDNIASNATVPAALALEGGGAIIYCPGATLADDHPLHQHCSISKSTGKTRSFASTKGRQIMPLQPIPGDSRMLNFDGKLWITSTPDEIETGIADGIVNQPK